MCNTCAIICAMKKCSNCNKELNDYAQRCDGCGEVQEKPVPIENYEPGVTREEFFDNLNKVVTTRPIKEKKDRKPRNLPHYNKIEELKPQIEEMLDSGVSSREIARRLGISKNTVIKIKGEIEGSRISEKSEESGLRKAFRFLVKEGIEPSYEIADELLVRYTEMESDLIVNDLGLRGKTFTVDEFRRASFGIYIEELFEYSPDFKRTDSGYKFIGLADSMLIKGEE